MRPLVLISKQWQLGQNMTTPSLANSLFGGGHFVEAGWKGQDIEKQNKVGIDPLSRAKSEVIVDWLELNDCSGPRK